MEKKIVAISDIHGHLPELPECDIVCICGDIMPLHIQKNYAASISWLAGPFQKWALNLNCKHVIFIWGNHDFIGERLYKYGIHEPESQQFTKGMNGDQMHDLLFNCDNNNKIHILMDNTEVIEGIKFYGTPWCPELKKWAFYGSSEMLIEKFNNIPADFDVLLTHCPPKFGQQGVVLETNWNFGTNFGCEELQSIIESKTQFRSDVCYILSGHIHSGNHSWEHEGPCHYRNVSLKDENYEVSYLPLMFTIYK